MFHVNIFSHNILYGYGKQSTHIATLEGTIIFFKSSKTLVFVLFMLVNKFKKNACTFCMLNGYRIFSMNKEVLEQFLGIKLLKYKGNIFR